ncbi:unnamed protein product, partial [marine sediment metagenome]
AQLIKPSGYYNIKARRLKNFVNIFVNDFEGSAEKMFSGDGRELRKKLLNVNGIGLILPGLYDKVFGVLTNLLFLNYLLLFPHYSRKYFV